MKAVNLIPEEARRGGGSGTAGAPTFIVLGGLGLALLLVVLYVVSANGVKEREGRLATVQTEAQEIQAQAAALKPFGDFAALAQARVASVRQIADSRFDWATALRGLSVAMPEDVTLTSLDAALEGAPDVPGSSNPVFTLDGCTPSHRSTARMLASLRQISGVDEVRLSSSTDGESTEGAAGAGGCDSRPVTVSVKVAFAPVAAAPTAPAAPAGEAAPPAAGEVAPPAAGATTPADGSQAAPPPATTTVPATPGTPEVDTTAATNGGGS